MNQLSIVEMENGASITIGIEENLNNLISYLELYKAAGATCKDGNDGGVAEFDAALKKACSRNGKFISPKDMLEKTCSLSPKKNTWLHVAASHGNKEIIDRILCIYDKDSDQLFKMKNVDGDTVLHVAARAGHHSTVESLLSKHCDHLCLNNKGNQPLHEALNNSRPDAARCLINHDLSFPLVVNGEGKSALYLAIQADDAQTVRLILEKYKEHKYSATNTSQDSQDHGFILGLAIKNRNNEILEMMVDSEIGSLCARDEEGRTPLHWAALLGYVPEMLYLLNKCASAALIQDNDGSYPLHLASSIGHLEIVRHLLLYCPDYPERLNNKGQNFVHVAAIKGHGIIVLYALLNNDLAKVVINAQDNDENTPSHLAVINCHYQLVLLLRFFHKEVDFKKKNKEGKTTLDVAVDKVFESSFSFWQVMICKKMVNGISSYNKVLSTYIQNNVGYGSINVDDNQQTNTIMSFLIGFATTYLFNMMQGQTLGHNDYQFQVSLIFSIITILSVILAVLKHIWVIIYNPQRGFNFLNNALGFIATTTVSFGLVIILHLHHQVVHVKWWLNLVIFTGFIFLIFLVPHIIDFFCLIPLCIKYFMNG